MKYREEARIFARSSNALISRQKRLDAFYQKGRQLTRLTKKGSMTCIELPNNPLGPTPGHERILSEWRKRLILIGTKVDSAIVVSSDTPVGQA